MQQQVAESMFTSATTWLTKDYLEEKLRKRYNATNLKLCEVQLDQGSNKGDNYTSVMLRMKVVYRIGNSKDQRESLIVKSTTLGDNLQTKVLNEYGFYKRELIMYDKILPRIQDMIDSLGNKDKICPKTIHVDFDQSSIIFEDLKDGGYAMADRTARLDLEHVHLVLKKIAKFHAAAAVLNEKLPGVFANDFDRGLFNRHTQAMKPVHMTILDALLRYIAKQPELKNRYYEKLFSLKDRLMEYCERVFDVNQDHFMTLIHGDVWHTNMMFKYADEDCKKPLEVVLLDYQCCAYGSPAVDLHYFFNTSLRDELRLNHQLKLVQFYHKILVDTLKALNFQGKIPSLFDFRMQYEMRSFYKLFSTLIFQPIMICPDTEDADFMHLIMDDESAKRFKDKLFKNSAVQKYLVELLPIFDQMGLLDNMDSA